MPMIRDVPFVFLTARTSRDDLREGMNLGADDYITKPFTESDLLNAIAARTQRHGSIREKIKELTEHHRREIHAQWSHELLTPLNAVMGSLDLLEMDADNISRNELKELLAFIREGARRQERLSNKLIRYFSLEQRLQAPPPTKQISCQANEAVNAGVAHVEREETPEVRVTVSADTGEVALDKESLTMAISEVVSNALHFSPPNGSVVVTGTNRTGRYLIEITDQGPGMTAEQRANIGAFTQFERQKREQQGLGLGLAITRATAQMAGGGLTLEIGASGCGLRVVLDLPLFGVNPTIKL